MTNRLLLVDYENIARVDLSGFDDSYSAMVFVGATQNPPRAASDAHTAHRFKRVTFHKVLGNGKNALDFHIAFQLGRIFETSPKTVCFIISGDKGFDPLVAHIQKIGLNCRRVTSFDELAGLVCGRCNKDATIEHNGGRWCSNCGDFASQPDPRIAPTRTRDRQAGSHLPVRTPSLTCSWCYQPGDASSGLFDDGEWMCGGCMTGLAAD